MPTFLETIGRVVVSAMVGFLVFIGFAKLFDTMANTSEIEAGVKNPKYKITLFVTEIANDGVISYSRTYTTNSFEKFRNSIEFDNIKFNGSWIVEEIKD